MRSISSRTAGAAGCLAACLTLAAAAPALATDVAIVGGDLRIADFAAQPNALMVTPSAVGYDIVDDITDLTPGPGCAAVDPHHVSCLGGVARILVASGGGDDVVVLSTVAVPVLADGGEGNDLLEGGLNGDRMSGGSGQDTLNGGPGDDTLVGAGGDDLLQGGDGTDHLEGGDDADIVQGDAGSGDRVVGNGGPDLLEGGAGDDTLRGGAGSDVLVTGSGTDIASTGKGNDQVFGQSSDTVSCSAGDEVSTGSKAPPRGCARLPRNEIQPYVWPPPPEGTAGSGTPAPPGAAPIAGTPAPAAAAAPIVGLGLSARAAKLDVRPPDGYSRGRLLRRGDARTIKIRVPHKYDSPIRVLVITYGRDRQPLQSFYVNIRAKRWYEVANRGAFDAAWTTRAKCCF